MPAHAEAAFAVIFSERRAGRISSRTFIELDIDAYFGDAGAAAAALDACLY